MMALACSAKRSFRCYLKTCYFSNLKTRLHIQTHRCWATNSTRD